MPFREGQQASSGCLRSDGAQPSGADRVNHPRSSGIFPRSTTSKLANKSSVNWGPGGSSIQCAYPASFQLGISFSSHPLRLKNSRAINSDTSPPHARAFFLAIGDNPKGVRGLTIPTVSLIFFPFKGTLKAESVQEAFHRPPLSESEQSISRGPIGMDEINERASRNHLAFRRIAPPKTSKVVR